VSYGFVTGAIDSRELRNNTIRTQDIRNNDIRGVDIRNSAVQGRDVASNTLTGSDINEARLLNVNAKTLDGVGLRGLVPADATSFAPIPLGTGWSGVPGEQAPQFDVDPLGYVHLQGAAQGVLPDVALLPLGARPSFNGYFMATEASGTGAVKVTIEPDGDVKVDAAATEVALDGITFKAGG